MFALQKKMKKPLCPVCKKKPRRLYAGCWTVTCKNEKCRKKYYYQLAQAKRPKKKIKCTSCHKLFAIPKNLTRKRYTCGKPVCITQFKLKIVKKWKKQNPDLVAEQKRRWKQRVREDQKHSFA